MASSDYGVMVLSLLGLFLALWWFAATCIEVRRDAAPVVRDDDGICRAIRRERR